MPGIVAKGQGITDLAYLHKKIDERELFKSIDESDEDGEKRIFHDLRRALDASQTHASDKDTAIFASATIKRIMTIVDTTTLCHMPEHLFQPVLFYIRRVWDHQADVVCHESVDIFKLLVNIHLDQCQFCLTMRPEENAANCDWINELVQWLLEPTTLCRSRFKCLLSLVTVCPSLCVNLSRDFFNRTYIYLNNPTLSNVISELIVMHLLDNDDLWDFHAESIRNFVNENNSNVIKNRLLSMIEKKQQLRAFLQLLHSEIMKTALGDNEMDLVLEICRCLISTQKTKKSEENKIVSWVDFIDHETMLDAIIHVNYEVGISAWKLIVDHPKKTLPFTEQDLELMKVFLDANMTIQSSGARQTILATLKNALLRIGESSEPLLKSNNDEMNDTVVMYSEFVKFIAKSAFTSLSPKGNYNRRIMALMMIDILYNKENYIAGGKDRFVKYLKLDDTLVSNRLQKVLRCLDDSYDLCQLTALKILKNVDFGNIELDEDAFLMESAGLLTSSKSRNTSASGYRMQYFMFRYPDRLESLLTKFVSECDFALSLAEEELMNITSAPIHPVLNTIQLLLEHANTIKTCLQLEFWKTFISTRLLPMCHRVIEVVTPVVHNLSPEGYIPEEKLTKMGGASGAVHDELAQHLLVCCWRAHKHVSAIFECTIRVFAPMNEQILTEQHVSDIGNFYWNQLTECKHRGAFECAVEGFTQLCRFLWASSNENHPKPARWLDEILNAIAGHKDLSNLCSTRRSAGLPHLVVSILSTEPEGEKCRALKKAADSLLDMSCKSVEYRIHSMNVMKAVIMSSVLSEKVPFCLEKTLSVSINCCRAEWSERNAASQLFAALRTRIFGVSRSVQRTLCVDAKNRKSNYEFFSMFPSLYRFIYDQLLMCNQSEFSILPPLVVLSHLSSPPSSSSYIYSLCPFVVPLLKIAVREKWENVRANAVAAILAIADIGVRLDLCEWISQFDFTNARQNHIHVMLLLAEGLAAFNEYTARIKEFLQRIVESLEFKKWCDFNLNLFLSMANQLLIDYDVDELPLESMVLSKRPVARKLLADRDALKTEMSGWLRDRDVRREVYRWIGKIGWGCCNIYLRAYVVSLAARDLPDVPQVEAKIIMDILSSADEFFNEDIREKLCQIVDLQLSNPESLWNLMSTISSAMQLKSINENRGITVEYLNWIEVSFESEDAEAREIALNVGCRMVSRLYPNVSMSSHFYKPNELRLIAAVAKFLQDDDVEMRRKASYHLSHLANCNKRQALNPAVCRLLIHKWIMVNAKYENDEDLSDDSAHFEFGEDQLKRENREELFDACAVNNYAESAYFGDIDLYKPLFHRAEGSSEVFEMDMDD